MHNRTLEVKRTLNGRVAPGENVIFDEQLISTPGISYDIATGVITFNEIGQYSIRWWIATETTLYGAIEFGLQFSQGELMLGSSPQKTGQVSGFGAIDIMTAGSTLSLINTTATDNVFSIEVVQKGYLLILPIAYSSPTGALTIIPFAARRAWRTFGGMIPEKINSLGFGAEKNEIAINSDGTINIYSDGNPEDDPMGFVLPYDAVIKSIYLEVIGYNNIDVTFYPYVELFSAPPDSDVLTPIPESITMVEGSFPPNARLVGSNTGLNIQVSAGTLLVIGARVTYEPEQQVTQDYLAAYSGGIAISPL